jgi:transposase
MDDNEIKSEGWSKKGNRLYAIKKFKKTQRISFISALNANKIFAPFIFEGSCTRDVFETYLERVLIPELKAGQILVIDNASFHKGGRITKLIEAANCRILYLPTYSPDLNPIEHHWFSIKNKIRKLLGLESSNIYDAAITSFRSVCA